ncbi:MAG TPA: hypothetical protein VHV55_19825 [Pirellulales bacterium]|nr:hypothetical protein [Pirellulales bacterium]
MITIARSLARTLRTVFRRAGIKPGPNANLLFQAAGDELIIQASSGIAAVQYRLPIVDQAERLVAPLEFLDATEGRSSDPVTLERQPNGKVLVQWTDRGIPQMLVQDVPAKQKDELFLEPPAELTSCPAGFLDSLHNATACADRDVVRYALDHLQLRGSVGQIVATDGRQVLRQGGFSFPWADDLLVPALGVFSCKELPQDEPVSVGKTDDWIVLRVEPWTLWLRINKQARFPKVDDLIRPASSASSRLTLSQQDAIFLANSLPSLPCDDPLHDPITIELSSQIAIRARGEGQSRPTELVLVDSSYAGEPVTINTNRRFLAQALKLGFREICIYSPSSPALCDNGSRQYLWALLEPSDAIKASDDALRIESLGQQATHSTVPFKPRRKTPAMPANKPETPVEQPTEQPSAGKTRRRHLQSANPMPGSPIDQAIALRAALRNAATQANELIRSLKRQKRQTKLVASALGSLKELQKVAG